MSYIYTLESLAMSPHGILETVVYAADLAAAERFYTEVVGLQMISSEPQRHLFFRSGEGMFLVFNPAQTESHSLAINGVHIPLHGARGPGHAAFRVFEAELPAWRERLQRLGVPIEAEITWPQGGYSIYVRDPAGNSIEFVTPAIWGLSETG